MFIAAIVTFVLFFAFVFYSLPAAFLPIYDQSHNVSSTWTGTLIGAGPLRLTNLVLTVLLLVRYKSKTKPGDFLFNFVF